jgi:hypothetical protein
MSRAWKETKDWASSLFTVALLIWPPVLGVAALPIWPENFGFLTFLGFFGLALVAFTLWDFAVSASGFLRWQLYHVWRPGMRPCMCDQPTYCFKHSSSRDEPNRPGLVEAKLREDS